MSLEYPLGMLAKYADAIARLLAAARARIMNESDLTDAEVAHGLCQEISQKLAKLFPELTIQRGYCNGSAHWWTTTADGEIIDGTAIQFGNGPYNYRAVDVETEEICVGRCANCGEDIMGLEKNGRKMLCGKVCEKDYAAYIMGF
jgi:hypothetical protein